MAGYLQNGGRPVRHEAVLVAAVFWLKLWTPCFNLLKCWLGSNVAGLFIPDVKRAPGEALNQLAGMAFICAFAFL